MQPRRATTETAHIRWPTRSRLLSAYKIVDFYLLVVVVDIMSAVERIFQVVERGELAECLSIIDLSERVGVPDAFSATPYVIDYRPRHATLGIVVVDLEMPLS